MDPLPSPTSFSIPQNLHPVINPNLTITTTALPPHPSPPVTPVRAPPSNLINSPRHSLLFIPSGPPTPVPRDDIIEGMSLSASSIFERDVELLDPKLTAHDATEIAIPSVLDEAFEVLATTDQIPDQSFPDSARLQPSLFSDPPCTPPRKRPGMVWLASSPPGSPSQELGLSPASEPSSAPPSSVGRGFGMLGAPWERSCSTMLPSSLPGLHHRLHCTTDTMSISDTSSPRSPSPSPSIGFGLSLDGVLEPDFVAPKVLNPALNLTAQALQQVNLQHTLNYGHRRLASRDTISSRDGRQLSFMSYADLINSERLASQTSPSLSLARFSPRSTSSRGVVVHRAQSAERHLKLGVVFDLQDDDGRPA